MRKRVDRQNPIAPRISGCSGVYPCARCVHNYSQSTAVRMPSRGGSKGCSPHLVCAQWLITVAQQPLQLTGAFGRENRTKRSQVRSSPKARYSLNILRSTPFFEGGLKSQRGPSQRTNGALLSPQPPRGLLVWKLLRGRTGLVGD